MMPLAGSLVHCLTTRQNRLAPSLVPLIRCDEFQGTMTMTAVVPGHELMHPPPGRIQVLEELLWSDRCVLQCPEQVFGIRIIVAHRRPAE